MTAARGCGAWRVVGALGGPQPVRWVARGGTHDQTAVRTEASPGASYYPGAPGRNGNGVLVHSFSDIRIAHIHPAVDHLSQTWSGQRTKGGKAE